MGLLRWTRLREAASATGSPALLRGQDTDNDTEPDADQDEMHEVDTCPGCAGTGIAGATLCAECNGAGGPAMKESTSGPYWVYSDDPEWESLREASRTFSGDVRKKYASSGIALPDGSYPIPDKDALNRAVSSYGHNPTAAVKAHIVKRAGALGDTAALPEDWQSSKEADSFGGKKAAPFGKKDTKDGKKDAKDGKDSKGDSKDSKNSKDDKPPWLQSKESATVLDRLETLEGKYDTALDKLKSIREAKPGSMTPAFSNPTRVKTSSGLEGYAVTLIREGVGNAEDDQWYTDDAVRELCESGVAEGMQAYGDHPTEDEEEERPERSVKELVGTYHDVKFAESDGRARADAIFVPLTLDENHPRYGWVVTLAEAATRNHGPQPICGISLYGLSAGEDGQRPDGTMGRMVSMIRPSSGDIVTNAGAGGGFVRQLMESARALRQRSTKELSPMKAMAYQSAVREAAKRVREADSDEVRQAALESLAELESEQIDNVPDSVEALREAAPKLVGEIESSVKAESGEDLSALREENRTLKENLGKFTDAIGITEALREAGVDDPTEIRYYAGKARERGLREADDVREMVVTDRKMDEKRNEELLAKMQESIGASFDSEIEGAVARVPATTLPTDGGLDHMRESGIPILDAE